MAKTKNLSYEPSLVKLTGTIKMLTFPGPPNYESISNGDEDETGPYFILPYPVDITPKPDIEINNNEPEKNIKIIQLIVENDKDWKKIEEGNTVEIDGTLSHALTGHHHARVLLTIKKIRIVSANKTPIKKLNILDVTYDDWQFLQDQNLQN